MNVENIPLGRMRKGPTNAGEERTEECLCHTDGPRSASSSGCHGEERFAGMAGAYIGIEFTGVLKGGALCDGGGLEATGFEPGSHRGQEAGSLDYIQ